MPNSYFILNFFIEVCKIKKKSFNIDLIYNELVISKFNKTTEEKLKDFSIFK